MIFSAIVGFNFLSVTYQSRWCFSSKCTEDTGGRANRESRREAFIAQHKSLFLSFSLSTKDDTDGVALVRDLLADPRWEAEEKVTT